MGSGNDQSPSATTSLVRSNTFAQTTSTAFRCLSLWHRLQSAIICKFQPKLATAYINRNRLSKQAATITVLGTAIMFLMHTGLLGNIVFSLYKEDSFDYETSRCCELQTPRFSMYPLPYYMDDRIPFSDEAFELAKVYSPLAINLIAYYYLLRCYPKQQQVAIAKIGCLYNLIAGTIYSLYSTAIISFTQSMERESEILLLYDHIYLPHITTTRVWYYPILLMVSSILFFISKSSSISVPLIYGYLTGHYPIHFKKRSNIVH